MAYKFIKTPDPENHFDRTRVEIEIADNDIALPDLVEAFQDFLTASGFSFQKQNIEVVEEESDYERGYEQGNQEQEKVEEE